MKADDMDSIQTSDAGQGETRNEGNGAASERRRAKRVFRPECKLAILDEYDRCGHNGQRGRIQADTGLE